MPSSSGPAYPDWAGCDDPTIRGRSRRSWAALGLDGPILSTASALPPEANGPR